MKLKRDIYSRCGYIFILFLTLMFFSIFRESQAQNYGEPWKLHIIDDSSIGADGVKLADADEDGLPDIVTGWEESGVVKVYINPGIMKTKDRWKSVVVGKVNNVEDAVFVDIDNDGALDVVSSCEGNTKSIFIHWAPKDKNEYMKSSAWRTEVIPSSKNVMQWMFCIPMQVDGKNGIDLVVGGKNDNARIGWFEAPKNSRSISEWSWHPVSKAGWIMSLFAVDMDNDGDPDIVTSDRRREMRGCRWLENPGYGPAQTKKWKNHFIGGKNREVMFMTFANIDKNMLPYVLAAVKPKDLLFFRHKTIFSHNWESFAVNMPDNTGTAKAVESADIDMDGRLDIVFSCEHAEGKSGVMWMSYKGDITDNNWDAHEISGKIGTKYDLLELLDLDGDGDLDVITCEEKENLGVIWYENPAK